MSHRPESIPVFRSSLASLARLRVMVVGALIAALALFGVLPALHAASHAALGAGTPHVHHHAEQHAHHAGHACAGHSALVPADLSAHATSAESERPLDSSCHTCVELLLASTFTAPGLALDWAAPALEVAGFASTDSAGVMTAREIALAHARGPPAC